MVWWVNLEVVQCWTTERIAPLGVSVVLCFPALVLLDRWVLLFQNPTKKQKTKLLIAFHLVRNYNAGSQNMIIQ